MTNVSLLAHTVVAANHASYCINQHFDFVPHVFPFFKLAAYFKKSAYYVIMMLKYELNVMLLNT